MLAASGVAQAFPGYSFYPSPENVLNSNQLLESINVNFTGGGSVVVDDSKVPFLYSEDGDEVLNTTFKEFMGSVLIKFDSAEILTNGEWTLTIPAGAITVGGEANTEITAVYTLNDPNLNMGEFPQIEFLGATPGNGTKLAVWGGENLKQVKLSTSNDEAVNYIEWTLVDVTTGTYVRQGNDNRFDFNRYHHNDDIWTDGLFIAVEGGDKLILDHEYRLDLRFCGIGYDPATKQYPNPMQIEMSTECEASVTYYGLTEPQEYAEAQYGEVSPNPEEYSITSPEFAVFHIEYTAPAKPVAFTYSLGSGLGVQTVGTYAPFEGMELDANKLCTKWTFTMDPSIVKNMTGSLTVNVESVDGDGRYVKGNSNMDFDDIIYSITWDCNCGAPDLISVLPADGAELESLSSITISNDKDGRTLTMAPAYQGGVAEIRTLDMATVRTLDEPMFSEDNLSATWTFEPITESGTYILMIPATYFALGEEMDGAMNNETSFRYYVVNQQSSNAEFDLYPASVTPEDFANVESLGDVVLTFENATFYPMNGSAPKVKLLKMNGPDGQVIQELDIYDASQIQDDGNFFEPKTYTLKFAEVTEPGEYQVYIPQGVFCDETYDMNDGQAGHANPDFQLTYMVGPSVEPGGDVSYTFEPASITPEDGQRVEILENVTVEYGREGIYASLYNEAFYAQLYKIVTEDTDGDGFEEEIPTLIGTAPIVENDYMNPTAGTYTFSPAVTEPGQYLVVIPQGAFGDSEYDASGRTDGLASMEITLHYTVTEPAPLVPAEYSVKAVSVTPKDGAVVSEISAVTVQFSEVVFPAQTVDGAEVIMPEAQLVRVEGTKEELVESVPSDAGDNLYAPTTYTFNFTEVTEKGVYNVVIPRGIFGDNAFLDSKGATGIANEEITVMLIVSGAVGIESILDGEKTVNVYDVNGVQLLKDADVEAVKDLKSGLYIINGKKVMIRK